MRRLLDHDDVDYGIVAPGGTQTRRKLAGDFDAGETSSDYRDGVSRARCGQVRKTGDVRVERAGIVQLIDAVGVLAQSGQLGAKEPAPCGEHQFRVCEREA